MSRIPPVNPDSLRSRKPVDLTSSVNRLPDPLQKHPGGCLTRNGKPLDTYGFLPVNGRQVSAHRVVFAIAHKVTLQWIGTAQVHHRCGHKGCLNPEHLSMATQHGHKHAHAMFNQKLAAAREFGTPEPEWIELDPNHDLTPSPAQG